MIKLLLTIAFFSCMQTLSFSQGFLHRDGKKIVQGNGNEIILRGMGLGGWMIQEGYMMETGAFAGTQHQLKTKIADLIGEDNMNGFYDAWLANHCTKADIDSLKKWGFNSIRLPMHYNLFTLPIEKEPIAGQNTWLEKGFTLVDSLLTWCEANQMYLILDLHAAPGGQGHDANISDYDNTKPSLWENADNRSKTVALWKKIAERYKDKTWIGGYDLLNETNWELPGGTMLKQLYVDIIAAIRTVDNNHMVIIEGNSFGNDYTGLLSVGSLVDQNMACSFHKYWNETTTGTIQWMLDIRNSYNVPIWLGESGENSNEWFRQTIMTMDANGIGWSWWPLKKINNVVGPATIVETNEYRTLLNYWQNGGTKPTVDFAKNALMKIADNAKIQNCTIHPDVIDAMFRQTRDDASKPFKKLSIPGTIFCTDFDMGKANAAYWDSDNLNNNVNSTAGNLGGAYRNDGIDIEKCTDPLYSNGYNIGWINKGEWMNYTVNVSQSGFYDIIFRVSSTAGGGMLHIEVDGQDVTGTVVVPNTSGYQSWTSVESKNINLSQGTRTITLKIDQGGFNLNAMVWSGPTAVTKEPFRLLSGNTDVNGTFIKLNFDKPLKPGIIAGQFNLFKGTNPVSISSAEIDPSNTRQIILHVSGFFLHSDQLTLSYNGNSVISENGEVLAGFSNFPIINNLKVTQLIPGRVESENFAINSGFSSENCSDTGGGKDMGFTNTGDYLEYLIYVSNPGNYTVQIRYATPDASAQAKLSLYDNNSETVLATVNLPQTGDWQTWATVTASVNLPAGIHSLRYTVVNPRFNTNYLNFINNATSTGENIISDEVELFPNPSKGIVFLKINERLGNVFSLEIFDLLGKIQHREAVRSNNEPVSIDLSDKAKGVYFIKTQSQKFIETKKFILE